MYPGSWYFKTFRDPRNRFQGVDNASLFRLAGRFDNYIPTRFLAPIDCYKIPALAESFPWNGFLGSLNVSKFGLCTFNFQTKKFKMATRKTSRKLSVDLARKISAISVASDVSGISERYLSAKHLAKMDF
jgi:hypothetical protein